jgi:adenylosuccinate synthase
MKAIAVIGANYGDEGKGLTVDYLAHQHALRGWKPVIVRFNGGGQAGHTVVTADGKRHVFQHVGAGSFVPGARTYLSSRFIINPYTLHKELAALNVVGVDRPQLLTHPQCSVTTVYDMAINSLAELSRGISRHGSCGMGINETVTRTDAGFPLRTQQVIRAKPEELAHLLKDICETYVPHRLEQLGITENDLVQHDVYARMLRPSNYQQQAEFLQAELMPAFTILDKAGLDHLIGSMADGQDYILEGAQGLALDEQLGDFPYVTRSVTGLLAAGAVAAYELNVFEIEPLYITRAYTTRHGAGPLSFEFEPITAKELADATNVDNQWQGSLRRAPLNLLRMKGLIDADVARTHKSAAVLSRGLVVKRPQLMVTCLDQLGPEVNIVTVAGQLTTVLSADLPQAIARELGRDITVTLCSYGPTAADVKSWMI